MWQIVEDKKYHGYLLSVYKYVEEGHIGDWHQIMVREGEGLDPLEGEWYAPIYQEETMQYSAAMAMGEAFVMGILTERQNGVRQE